MAGPTISELIERYQGGDRDPELLDELEKRGYVVRIHLYTRLLLLLHRCQ